LRVALPEGDMDGSLDLLVEERVPHVALDPGITPDAELTDLPGALVAVENLEQWLLIPGGLSLNGLAFPEHEPDPCELLALVHRGNLSELDHTVGRALDRREEELTTGYVHAPVVELALATRQAESQVGPGSDDANLLGRVEPH